MIAHEVFAMIADNTVQNVCVGDSYEEANRVARAVYGDDAVAVDCLQYPCAKGDRYINGVFYKPDGVTPIEYIPTQEQQIQQLWAENMMLKQESQEMTLALADMIGGAI